MEFAILLVVLYFVPALVAYHRGTTGRHGVLALNVLLGWTLLGWIAAFVWSLGGQKGSKHK